MMKKIYMEKAVASGVLFWEVVVMGSETICKAGKVGARCNEYPPNAHATSEEANNFFKYLVEQKKKQGFAEVEGTVAKARAVPNKGADQRKSDSYGSRTEVILGERNVKKKPLNGTKEKTPLHQRANFRTPVAKRAYSPVPIKRKPSPVRMQQEDLPVKRVKPVEKPKPVKKFEEKTETGQPVRKRGRPPKAKPELPEKIEKTPRSNTKRLSRMDTQVVSDCDNSDKGVSPITKARGRPRKVVPMEAETLPPMMSPMEAETMPPLISKMTTTSSICDKLSRAKIESQKTVEMESAETLKKWKEWRFDEPEDSLAPDAGIKKEKENTTKETKTEPEPSTALSPSLSTREPRKRKMTSKYEIYRQETLGLASPLRGEDDDEEDEEEEEPKAAARKSPVKKQSTTAAIRQGLSKTKLDSKEPVRRVGRPKKSETPQKDSPKAKLTTIMKKKPLLKGLANVKTGRVKAGAQAKLGIGKQKGTKLSPLAAKAERRAEIMKQSKGIKRKYSALEKGGKKLLGSPRLTPAEFLAKIAGKSPAKSPLVTPSKLQLTPSRMSMTPALAPPKHMNTTATPREESPQPVIKRRRVASSSELTIASEFGTVHKPSVDDWPAFIPAPVVWQVPFKRNDEDCNGQALLVDPDRCYIADDTGTVIEINSNAVPRRTWTLPSAVNCMMEHRFRIYAGCDDGVIYEVLKEPKLLAKVEDFGRILSIGAYDDYIVVSDEKGNVAQLDKPTGEVRWKNKSPGEFGWMVCIDQLGVFHGTTTGVTKYNLLGNRMYHLNTDDNVLDGVQNKDFLYVSCGPYVLKIDKLYGTVARTYDKGAQYTGLVHSVAVGGGLVYAGGAKIGCYDEVCGELVYCFDLPYTTAAIQYFSGRLFSIGTGMFSVIDFSPDNIEKTMEGEAIDPITIVPVALPEPPAELSANAEESGSGEKPQPRQGVIKVRQLSMQRL